MYRIILNEEMQFDNGEHTFDDFFCIKCYKGDELDCNIKKRKNFVRVEIFPPYPYGWLNSRIEKYSYEQFKKLTMLQITKLKGSKII